MDPVFDAKWLEDIRLRSRMAAMVSANVVKMLLTRIKELQTVLALEAIHRSMGNAADREVGETFIDYLANQEPPEEMKNA